MRFLIVDTYYPAFLKDFYQKKVNQQLVPYEEQWRALMDECFGTADFYSANLKTLGHEAIEVIPNAEHLQRRWASEHGLSLPPQRTRLTVTRRRGVIPWPRRISLDDWSLPVLRAQIADFRPDVLFIQDMHTISPAFMKEVRPYTRLIVGQIASPAAREADFSQYDLILTSLPHFVESFRAQGLVSHYFRLGFEPRVLDRLRSDDHHPVVFIGGLSDAHSERVKMLEYVTVEQNVDFWGYGFEALPFGSPLRRTYHGSAWGLKMYGILHSGHVALNQHGGVAEEWANNMRLYEATGVGTLLITDEKKNLSGMFDLEREVLSYRSPEECLEKIRYCLSHPEQRKSIAAAGQARTLKEHTYYHRMQELVEIVRGVLESREKL